MKNVITVGLIIITILVLVGLFAPLSIYTTQGTCTQDVSQTQLIVKLHLIRGQTISRQKELDATPSPTGEGCRMAAKYIQYFF